LHAIAATLEHEQATGADSWVDDLMEWNQPMELARTCDVRTGGRLERRPPVQSVEDPRG
jgi:hypothetical protein